MGGGSAAGGGSAVGGGSGMSGGGAGGGDVPIAIPAAAPYDTWTFIQIPGMVCADGTPTGIAINPHAGSTRLFFYLQGGGRCSTYQQCFVDLDATHLDGYGPQQFNIERALLLSRGVFQRTNAVNPFRDFNYVYVPYCTGDFHMGHRVTSYLPDGGAVIHHVGAANVEAVLTRVAPTFPNATQLVVAGSSAGGFGAPWNLTRVASKWSPSTDLVLIDDSGPYLSEPYFTRAVYEELEQRFGFSTTVPGCAQCKPDAGGFSPIYRYNVEQYPNHRGALISSKRDTTISTGLAKPPGNPNLACDADGGGPCEFEAGLLQHVAGPLADAGYKAYIINGADHVWLSNPAGTVTSGGVPLSAFLNRQLNNDPQWRSVVPP